MSLRSLIIGADNPILRTVSSPVKTVDAKARNLIKDLKDSLIEYKGLGLAAPQIGVNLRVILVFLNHSSEQSLLLPMINPVIKNHSQAKAEAEEGCLSLPGDYYQILRFTDITVEFLNASGQPQILKLKDLNSRIVQHEIDHLDGVLIVDHGQKTTKSEKKDVAPV